jgi:tetratricopeptide (TPR) repeat protein
VAFGRQKYSTALENFCKAVQCHPSCGAGIRVAIANCCFRLGQYERAKFALDKALSLDVRLYYASLLYVVHLYYASLLYVVHLSHIYKMFR